MPNKFKLHQSGSGTVAPITLWLGSPSNQYIWECQLKFKVTDSAGVSTCSGDGSSFGEVALDGVVTIDTSSTFDHEFCKICKLT